MALLNSHTMETAAQAELLARIAELEAANAKLRAAKSGKLSMKVTEKGGLSVYGLGRFPVTLYAGQWERLLEGAEQIKAFISAHGDSLSRKE